MEMTDEELAFYRELMLMYKSAMYFHGYNGAIAVSVDLLKRIKEFSIRYNETHPFQPSFAPLLGVALVLDSEASSWYIFDRRHAPERLRNR